MVKAASGKRIFIQGATNMLGYFGKKIRYLFMPEEVEVTFQENKKHVVYTYTVLHRE
jgi:hypothetical protein